MKKSSLRIAVLGACAGAATAQSSVTVYGVVDAGIAVESGGPNGRVVRESGGGETPSRIGFKGREDLGGGMSASFVLESGFTVDTGASAQGGLFLGRQAWVGVENGFGGISLGRQYRPFFLTLVDVDPFLVGLAGNSLNLMNAAGVRMNNSIKYSTPKLGPVSADVMYGFGEQPGDTSAGRQVGASISYAEGPLLVKLGYDNSHGLPTATLPGVNARNTLLIARYTWRGVTGYLGYGINKSDRNSNAQNADSRDAIVGVKIPYGPGTFIASVIRKQDKTAANLSATQVAVAYTYALSKRTDLYASYGRISNNAPNTATTGFYTVGNGADPGSGDRALLLGVRHLF
jgi:predicted porin